MISGFYSAGTALDLAARNQELVAENLANAATPGYRQQGLFVETLQGALPDTAGWGAQSSGAYTSFVPGPVQQTGQPLDLAIAGDAFFVLDGPTGPVYTRSGVFELNTQGDLQTRSGLRVRGVGGRINVPPTAAEITVGPDGTVRADNAEVGRLQLAQFANLSALRRVGPTLFDGPAPRAPEPGSVRIEQGYREGSNVQVVNEMVSMIVGMRQYEAAERALRAMADAVGMNTRPQG